MMFVLLFTCLPAGPPASKDGEERGFVMECVDGDGGRTMLLLIDIAS